MACKKVTGQSLRGLLDIPPDFVCYHCVPSITKCIQNGKACKLTNKCSQPWAGETACA